MLGSGCYAAALVAAAAGSDKVVVQREHGGPPAVLRACGRSSPAWRLISALSCSSDLLGG